MSDQQVKYTITADASQANSELAKVDKAAASLVGNEKALATETAKATAAIREQGKVATTAAVATARAAGSTRNMGQAALEASRGLEDLQYGIGGVVNNIPSLVMALGGGMGLTAAISLAAVGLNQVYKNFVAVPKAADTAVATAKTYVDDLKKEIIDLGKEIRTLQVGATKVAAEEQSKRIQLAMAEAKAAVDAIGGKDRLSNLLELTGGDAEKLESRFSFMQRSIVERSQQGPFVSEEAFNAAIAAQEKFELEARRMAALQLITLEEGEKESRDKREKDAADAADKRTKDAAKQAEEEAKLRYDIYVAGLDSEDKALKEVNEARRKDAKAQKEQEAKDVADSFKEMDRERAKNQKTADKEKLKQEKKSLKDIEAEQERHAKQNEQYATQAVGIVTGATQQYVEARIKGEKNAEAAFAASIMAQAGQALVSYGVQAIGRGVLEASSPLTAALAPASFAAGAGLIVAGTGLGGIGAGIGQIAAGGTIGKELPDKKAAKDKGASPGRGGSGSGGGGPLVVNVAYGAGGPLPEDTAREIQKAVDTGRRRGGR
jgi:hypothetical protein